MAGDIDHCTNWPDKVGSWDWGHCCQVHDLQYDLQVDKLTADWDLFICVADSSNVLLAGIMLLGVLALGSKYYMNAKRQNKEDGDNAHKR